MRDYDELSKKIIKTHHAISDLESDLKMNYEELISLNYNFFNKIHTFFERYIGFCPELKDLTGFVDVFEQEIVVNNVNCLIHIYDSNYSVNYKTENVEDKQEFAIAVFVDRKKTDDAKDIIEGVPLGLYKMPSITKYQSKYGYYDWNLFKLDEENKMTKDIIFVLNNYRDIESALNSSLFSLGNERLDSLKYKMQTLNYFKRMFNSNLN